MRVPSYHLGRPITIDSQFGISTKVPLKECCALAGFSAKSYIIQQRIIPCGEIILRNSKTNITSIHWLRRSTVTSLLNLSETTISNNNFRGCWSMGEQGCKDGLFVRAYLPVPMQ